MSEGGDKAIKVDPGDKAGGVREVTALLEKATGNLPDYIQAGDTGFLRDVWKAFRDGAKSIWRECNIAARPSAAGAKGTRARAVGDKMPDGTILAGISPGTQQPLYTTPRDARGTYTFKEAARYAQTLDAHGHHDFRVPSKGELNVLFENGNKGKLKGTFKATGKYPAGWYWTSMHKDGQGWAQNFDDGANSTTARGWIRPCAA